MANEERPFLNMLDSMLNDRGKDTIYPCIRDMLDNGLDLARFSAGERTPQRQAITQYMAAWSRHAGLSESGSNRWLVDYCVIMLSSLTTKSLAAIRHNAKSNLRYIYRSAVPFLCQCADNPFRAHCSSDCPVYADMQINLRAKASEALLPRPVVQPPTPLTEPILSVKEVYLEQFQAGMSFALDEVQKGTKTGRIIELLNELGMKTRTGRKWHYSILRIELQNLKKSSAPLQGGCKDTDSPQCSDVIQGAPPNDGSATPLGNLEGAGERPSSAS